MKINLDKIGNDVGEGINKFADKAHKSTEAFHNNYVSKIVPDIDRFGNVANFLAEEIPGVSEYNAIRNGDWVGFAIAAGCDIWSIATSVPTAGTGYIATKSLTGLAKKSISEAVKEVSKANANKIIKNSVTKITTSAVKEITEQTAKNNIKRVATDSLKIISKNKGDKIFKVVTGKISKDGVKLLADKKISNSIKELTKKKGKDLTLASLEKINKINKNSEKIINKILYKTDGMARVKEISGYLKLKPKTPRLSSEQIKAVNLKDGIRKIDDGAHIIAREFGGIGQANLVPMNSYLNRYGGWRKMERELKLALKNNKKVYYKANIIYPKDLSRPDKFKVKTIIDGKTKIRIFINERSI